MKIILFIFGIMGLVFAVIAGMISFKAIKNEDTEKQLFAVRVALLGTYCFMVFLFLLVILFAKFLLQSV